MPARTDPADENPTLQNPIQTLHHRPEDPADGKTTDAGIAAASMIRTTLMMSTILPAGPATIREGIEVDT